MKTTNNNPSRPYFISLSFLRDQAIPDADINHTIKERFNLAKSLDLSQDEMIWQGNGGIEGDEVTFANIAVLLVFESNHEDRWRSALEQLDKNKSFKQRTIKHNADHYKSYRFIQE